MSDAAIWVGWGCQVGTIIVLMWVLIEIERINKRLDK